MNDLISFDFESQPVRVIDREGEPWFVGADVARVLGYANPRKAVRDHCRRHEPLGGNGTFHPGLDPQTLIIPEPDLYRLIMRSKMPAAERFEDWVASEVLPSIRKTGGYGKPGLTTSEVAKIAAAAAEATVMRIIGTGAECAKDDGLDLVRAVKHGILIRELIALLDLPEHINRRSVAAALTARLSTAFMNASERVYTWAGARHFPRLKSIELAQRWRAELIERAGRDKRQTVLRLVPKPDEQAQDGPSAR